MDEAVRCPQCGAVFSGSTSPLGLCPACLLRLGVSDPAGTPIQAAPRPASPRTGSLWIPLLSSLTLVVVFGLLLAFFSRRTPDTRVIRFSIGPPPNTEFVDGSQLALSPDGLRLAWIATAANGERALWVRPLD